MPDGKRQYDTPFLTDGLPGTGGRIRERIEDFVVEELPLYEPSGAGEHLYVLIQKSGLSTHEAVRRIGHALNVAPKRIGYAGLKDARALTRQTISVAGAAESRVRALEVEGVQVLDVQRHRNKLRIGHLRGNRFLIRVRGVDAGAEERASLVLDRLAECGVPNFFGAQRFGSGGDSHLVGRELLRGDAEAAVQALLAGPRERERDPRLAEARRRFSAGDVEGARDLFPRAFRAERAVLEELARGRAAEQAIRRIPKGVHRLLLSAYQSWLFNRLVRDRFDSLGRLMAGDLAFLHGRGAVFRVEDPEEEQPRADRFEISPSAPMFGRKVLLADGEPGERERALHDEEGLSPEQFGRAGVKMDGERRPMRVPLENPGVRPEGDDVILISFELPRGSFATVVAREVTKTPDEPGLDVPA